MPADLPLVTIGIPTYNRPHFLRESLASALRQSYPNVEVVVADNASDPADDVERVVQEVGDGRVRFHRNLTNVGPQANFLKTLDLATGDYFAWLQDDDLLFHDFAAKGVTALEAHPNAAAYLAFAVCSTTVDAVSFPNIYGPPLALNWIEGSYSVFEGAVVTPLSLFGSVANPPVMLFRTTALRRHQSLWADIRLPLFVERTLLASLGGDANLIAAPHVAGFFRLHSDQHNVLMRSHQKAYWSQWAAMAEVLDGLGVTRRRYESNLITTLRALPFATLSGWEEQSDHWPVQNELTASTLSVLRQIRAHHPSTTVQTLPQQVKKLVRDLCPPLAYRTASRLWHR